MYGMLPLGCGLLLWCYHIWYVTTWVWFTVVVLPYMVCYQLIVVVLPCMLKCTSVIGLMLVEWYVPFLHTLTHSWETDGYAR